MSPKPSLMKDMPDMPVQSPTPVSAPVNVSEHGGNITAPDNPQVGVAVTTTGALQRANPNVLGASSVSTSPELQEQVTGAQRFATKE
jgi:hypothetical protein